MSTPQPYWDGQRWLYWDGTRWVPQTPATGVPAAAPPATGGPGGPAGPRAWWWLVAAAVIAIAVAAGAYWLGTRVAAPESAPPSASPPASPTATVDPSTAPPSPTTTGTPSTTGPTAPPSESAAPTFPAELGRAAAVVDGFLGALQAGDLETAWGYCTQEFLDMGALGPMEAPIRSYRILNAEPAGDSVAVTVEEDWSGQVQEQVYYVVTWEGPPRIGAIENNVPEPPGP